MSTLPEPYFSKNGWIAQVDYDNCVINPIIHGKSKFLVVGWNPLGQKCAKQKVFNTDVLAQNWILSLDPQTQKVETEFGSATIFINLDGEYWWRDLENNQTFHKLYIAYSMEHAVALTKSGLESNSLKKVQYFNKTIL